MEKVSSLFEMKLQPLVVGTGLDEDTSGAGEAERQPGPRREDVKARRESDVKNLPAPV